MILQSVTKDDDIDVVTLLVCGCTQCQPCRRTSSPVNTPGDDGDNNEGMKRKDDEDEGEIFNWNDRGYGVDLASLCYLPCNNAL